MYSLIVEKGVECGRKTKRNFDITLGPIKWLWGFGNGLNQHYPTGKEVINKPHLVDFNKVI